MDPNATLARIRELTRQIAAMDIEFDLDHEGACGYLSELADLTQALDEWMSKLGYLPRDWQKGR